MTDDEKKARADVLMKMFQEHMATARHHETQRSTLVQYILAAGAVIGTLIGASGPEPQDVWLCGFLVALGLFGALFSVSLSLRVFRHRVRAGLFRNEIDEAVFSQDALLDTINQKAERHVHRRFKAWMRFGAEDAGDYAGVSDGANAGWGPEAGTGRDPEVRLPRVVDSYVLWGIFPLLVSFLGVLLLADAMR